MRPDALILAGSILLGFSVPVSTLACFAPKPGQAVPFAKLIATAKKVALARMDRAGPVSMQGRQSYHFRTLEALKGDVASRFIVEGSLFDGAKDPRSASDFDGHSKGGEWGGGNRVGIDPDCVIRPSFEKGTRYLVFLDPPYHLHGFEKIARDDDAWLAKVRKTLKAGGAKP